MLPPQYRPVKYDDRVTIKFVQQKFILGILKKCWIRNASQAEIIWPGGPFKFVFYRGMTQSCFFIASTTQYGAEANNLWMKFVYSVIWMNHIRFLPFSRKSSGNISKEINARVVWGAVSCLHCMLSLSLPSTVLVLLSAASAQALLPGPCEIPSP
jgi:hypothetical protein